MLIIALTGGIGSGKSLVARYFFELGAKVVDADDLARSAIERGSKGFDEVVAAFGDVILKDGHIDRRALAERIFSDPNAKRTLEEIVHPLVRQGYEDVVAGLKDDEILIYEIPLLVETGAQDKFDFTITVESEEDLRTARLLERGMSRRDIEARILSQASSEARRKAADFIIENNGSADDLLRQVEHVWENVIPKVRAE
ncbi:MAG: dephospho-CoA kinase [Actinobacteria bacterium]|nr:dephospho-CoA kinase [Actinomycetota bacterium]